MFPGMSHFQRWEVFLQTAVCSLVLRRNVETTWKICFFVLIAQII